MAKLDLKPDDITELVVTDPGSIPETRMLAGWLGKSSEKGRWRLYTQPTFEAYLELDESEIIASRRMPEQIAPLGGTMLWVKANTKLVHTELSRTQAQASFLSGRIARAHLGRVGSNFTIGDGTLPHTTVILTLTVLVTTTILVIVSTATDADCPDPNNSAGLCPTGLSACCSN